MNTAPPDSHAQPDPFASPILECDIVMKGGITSGVVYPQAVVELARTYRLRSVGGASAGAIAAAAAAAAEVGRDQGGFQRLAELPAELTTVDSRGATRLASLFQPTRNAAPLFRVLMAAATPPPGTGQPAAKPPRSTTVRRAIGALLRGYPGGALLGALPGLLVVVLSALGTGIAQVTGIVAGLALALVGVALGVARGVSRTLAAMAPDGFGACTGMPGAAPAGQPALTPWLHGQFQAMAGLDADAPPLTFGVVEDHGVTLRMMTTNLSRHQPMVMPWTDREYFFSPAEFRTLFPAEIVDWMVAHPPPTPDGPARAFSSGVLRAQASAAGLAPWPQASDLPVVVATRMSLSFPGLITAVRLYAVDYTLPDNKAARSAVDPWRRAQHEPSVEQALGELDAVEFSPVWFSDGGLCSNLPVHFFDSPLPRRPSFAFNLANFPPDRQPQTDEADNSYLPDANSDGIQRPWFGLPTDGLGGWATFAKQIVETARTWVDAAQLTLPGYRDRIVTIYHTKDEGGMNLSMPAPVVAGLVERGRQGAVKLVVAFAGDAPGVTPAKGWENHRWVRFRAATAGLHGWLSQFSTGYHHEAPGATPYDELAGPGATAGLPSYPTTKQRRELINGRTGALVALASEWLSDDALTADAPRPRTRMRLVPDDNTASK